MNSAKEKILNYSKIIDIYGPEYSFHDAEIKSIRLHSDTNEFKSSATIQIHAFTMTTEVIDGRYKLTNHNIITFVVREIGRLNIQNWSYQNVAFGIVFEESAFGISLKCDSSCGSEFTIEGKSIFVENIKAFDYSA